MNSPNGHMSDTCRNEGVRVPTDSAESIVARQVHGGGGGRTACMGQSVAHRVRADEAA